MPSETMTFTRFLEICLNYTTFALKVNCVGRVGVYDVSRPSVFSLTWFRYAFGYSTSVR